MSLERRSHWDNRYVDIGPEQVSWYRPDATVSLDLLARAGARPQDALIDVGGGAQAFTWVALRRDSDA